MHTYVLRKGNKIQQGGLAQCLNRSKRILEQEPTSILTIAIARGGSRNAKIIAEVTHDGIRYIEEGETYSIRSLKSLELDDGS
ncbi:hypothetical protein BOW50_11380 [Solemya velum gill symbiont]|nr:hypothetical protein BOW50_11380 [Solemya velum gill symbiont]